MEHNITVGYTNDDDGIWLWCSCMWNKCLSFEPTVEQVAEAASRHRACPDETGDE